MGSQTGSGVGATVVVTGAAGALGRRVVALAAADPAVDRVVAIDRAPVNAGPGVEAHRIDLAGGDLKTLLDGAAALVHLAQPPGPAPTQDGPTGPGDADVTRRVLDAAGASGVRRVVLLSSATAYGAWADNPVPLTEDAPLRPNPGNALAAGKAELEAVVAEWRDGHPGATVAVLRPTVVVTEDGNGWLARALRRPPSLPSTGEEPPGQFLHLDDLVSAVDLARRQGLDGAFNVAPDGWVDGELVRALAGGPRVRLPARAVQAVVELVWRGGIGDTPPELLPLVTHPWVVANDRLRASGWEPTHTSEEAYVAAHRGGPLASLSPRRRQELALGATGAVLVGGAAGAVALLRRRRR
jgi:nucleoside-diphosphate-sugar epimerase